MSATESVSPVTLVAPGTWTVDPARSTVGFAVRHLKLTKVHGRFRRFDGAICSDAAGTLAITGLIDVASIDTGDLRRDARLRAEDFFDAGRYPTITVQMTSSAVSDGAGFILGGQITICGVQRPLELHVEDPPAPVNGNGDLRLRARGAISRRAFGLNWDPAFAAGGLVIDDRVALLLNVLVVRS